MRAIDTKSARPPPQTNVAEVEKVTGVMEILKEKGGPDHGSAHIVNTTRFQHIIFDNTDHKRDAPLPTPLYIFIEGDGQAWKNNRVSRDPTPKHPLMLSLMTESPFPALYLTRPCYFPLPNHPLSPNRACHPKWWTSHRYAPEIVTSMIEALQIYMGIYMRIYMEYMGEYMGHPKNLIWVSHKREPDLILVGHSGGGALALLMADQLISSASKQDEQKTTIHVITLAGNIDTEAWSEHHGYSPLSGSLNPKQSPHLAKIPQHHLLGEEDRNIPPELLLPLLKSKGLKHRVIKKVGHTKGWKKVWRDIIRSDDWPTEKNNPPTRGGY